jgi:hypothetical protein
MRQPELAASGAASDRWPTQDSYPSAPTIWAGPSRSARKTLAGWVSDLKGIVPRSATEGSRNEGAARREAADPPEG